ncbi:hypothetical protein WHR41_07821 [Cladosporium halotolerans]|uniref:DUF6590 domain-containing protein n=1 Tax=Cladosporium halotolerans TaxID=1052096 RepID=A0AB34KI08_9PEZI
MSSPTSSSLPSGIQWQLDPQTRRWFYIDSRTRQRVYHPQPQHQALNAPRSAPAPPREVPPFEYRPPRKTLDQDYKVRVHPRKFFKIGKVFLTLHTEPRGSNSTLNTKNHDIYTVALGEQAFSKIRRFIVVREGRDSCSALAISTHSGNGASRRNASEHGIVHTTGTRPPPTMRQEDGLLPSPIRIDPLNEDDRLDATSRMDYGKLYNIEHNVKVKPYGVVNNQSMQTLIKQWTQVFFGRAATPAATAFRSPNPQTLQALKFSPSQIRQVLNILSRRGADPRQVITSVARASAEEALELFQGREAAA